MQRYLMNIAYIGTKYKYSITIFHVTSVNIIQKILFFCRGATKNLNVKDHISIEDLLNQGLKQVRQIRNVELYISSRLKDFLM